MPTQLAYIYYNACFMKSVCFRIGIIELSEVQESIMMKTHKSTLINKLGCSKKFLRRILCARKSALGIGIMRPNTIADMLALKLYFRHKRVETRIGNLIQIIEDIATVESEYNKNIMTITKEEQMEVLIWIYKIVNAL